MNIKGIQKTSLVDYPGRISAVIFSGGCNLNCIYCHNPDLACDSCDIKAYENNDVLDFLRRRSNLIDGVVISGGEPTLSKNIDQFLEKIKESLLPVKIDTNGLNPKVIERLIRKGLLDYVAIDVKTSPEKYEFLAGKKVDFLKVKNTIDIVRDAGINYELRTTCIPHYVTLNDFESIKNYIGKVSKYYLQQFVNKITLDTSLQEREPYPPSVLYEFKEYVKTFSDICEIRGI